MASSRANMQWINLLHSYRHYYTFLCQTYHRPETPPESKPSRVRSTLLGLPQLHPGLGFCPSLLHFAPLPTSLLSSLVNTLWRRKRGEYFRVAPANRCLPAIGRQDGVSGPIAVDHETYVVPGAWSRTSGYLNGWDPVVQSTALKRGPNIKQRK